MPRNFKLELRCRKNDDGTFNAGIYDDGQQVTDPDYIVLNGDCKDMQELWRRASNKYNKNPQVVGDCIDCFTEGFFQGETLYPE